MNSAEIKSQLSTLSRRRKQAIVIAVDVMIVFVSFMLSLYLRLGEFVLPEGPRLIFALAAPLIAVPIFARWGLYRAVFRYVSVHMGWAILKAVTLFSLVLGSSLFLYGVSSIPRSAILINALVVFMGVSGSRLLARWWFTGSRSKYYAVKADATRVLIYGAGEAGVQLSSALDHSTEFFVAGFLDDDSDLHGKQIRGHTVFAPANLGTLKDTLEIDEVLLAIPSAPKSRKREIVRQLDLEHMSVRTLPGLDELALGKVDLAALRVVEIQDILGRDAVEPHRDLLHKNIAGKVVAVTGAGGSIGSELCRQMGALDPMALVLFEQSEYALYEILRDLNVRYPALEIHAVLGTVTDENHLTSVLTTHAVQTVYHAAAYKHVPMVEANAAKGVYNNVFGTWRAARAARAAGVESFVLISTDKAVRPTNVMGASKRMAEMILQCLSKKSDVLMTMVRFGNVLGSSGSVVPLFKEQIAQGGPITVTHPEVTRFFMTIPEAAQLVIQAGAMGKGGDVFVLDMGQSVKIVDLARRMVRLSGLDIKEESNPDGEIEIVYSGLRPGEKLYEELLIGDNTSETSHPLIMRAEEHHKSEEELQAIIAQLEVSIEADDQDATVRLLKEAVEEFEQHQVH